MNQQACGYETMKKYDLDMQLPVALQSSGVLFAGKEPDIFRRYW